MAFDPGKRADIHSRCGVKKSTTPLPAVDFCFRARGLHSGYLLESDTARGVAVLPYSETTAGMPTRISTGMALPLRIAGLNFHWLRARRAASSICGSTP